MSILQILFVEDNADLNLMSALFLKSAGHSVTLAHSGKEALGALEALKPDMIFLDLTLPDMGSDELVHAIRGFRHCADTPLVLASGKDELNKWAERLGAWQVLKKPYDRSQLLKVIADHMDQK